MPNKRNNCINRDGGRREPTFEHEEDDGTTTKQALTLPKRTKNKCKRNEEWMESQRCEKEMKLKRFLTLNNPHKAPFRSKIKWSITTRNPTVRVKRETTTPLHQRSGSCRLIRHQKRLKEVKWHVEKTAEKNTYSPLVILHVTRRINSCT